MLDHVARSVRGIRSLLCVLLLAALLTGCATPLVTTSSHVGFRVPQPTAEEAVVVFLRPSRGTGTHAAIYEDGRFIGLVMNRTYFIHRADPGLHRYMAASEAADFLYAKLNPGRVYFVRVEPRSGERKLRFTLLGLSPSGEDWGELEGWLASAREGTPNEEGEAWVTKNERKVKRLERVYLPKWLSKPDRPMLKGVDGIDPSASSSLSTAR